MSTFISLKAYTYLLKWSSTGVWYYGVRYARGCDPKDLWSTYFTSSKHVKNYVEENGPPDIIEIRKTFDDISKARRWEARVLSRSKGPDREDCLNRTDNISISPYDCSKNTKGKTYEQIHGLERASALRLKRSASNRARAGAYKWSIEAKKKAALRNAGAGNPRAKTITIFLGDASHTFTNMKEAASFLAATTARKPSACLYAIRSKLYGPAPGRRFDMALFDCFSV
jgi:hypothetical protein